MDWWTDGPMDGLMDGPMDGPIDAPMDGLMDGPIDGPTKPLRVACPQLKIYTMEPHLHNNAFNNFLPYGFKTFRL